MKTIYYVEMTTAMSTGSSYTPYNNTTLNEKFGDTDPLDVVVGTTAIQYFGVGIKPENYVADLFNNEIYIHDAIDACIYNPIPLMVIPIDQDGDRSLSDNYRIRKLEILDGEQYACYYLKKLSIGSPSNTFEVADLLGKPDLVIFDPTKYNVLDPVYGGKEIVPEKNKAIAHSKKIPLELTSIETLAMMKYIKAKYPTRIKSGNVYPNIGEIMLCHGLDGITSSGRKTVDGAQVSFFLDVEHKMDSAETMYQSFEIGGIETLAFNTSKVGI